MQFNGGKCLVSHISRKDTSCGSYAGVRGPTLLMDNSLNMHHLSLTSALLCAMTCPGLDKNNRHQLIVVVEANTIIGRLNRVYRDMRDSNMRKMLYCALIRPSLEYSRSLWSPYTQNVQRRATKFILEDPKDKSYKERLIKLDLLPLE